jgi:hypothetical protein
MLDQRSGQRFQLVEPADGVLHVLFDVVVQRHGDEWVAISREPAIVGETLTLDVFDIEGTETDDRFSVRVIESRPVIVEGHLRHRMRLQQAVPPVLTEQQIRR